MNFDPSSVIGVWYSELSSDPSQNGIFQITDDFRYIAFGEDTRPDAKRRWIPMRLWGSFEGENLYRLRPRKEDEGWTRRLSFDGDFLIFESLESDHKKWKCRKLNETEIPDWFKSEAAAAYSRPWK